MFCFTAIQQCQLNEGLPNFLIFWATQKLNLAVGLSAATRSFTTFGATSSPRSSRLETHDLERRPEHPLWSSIRRSSAKVVTASRNGGAGRRRRRKGKRQDRSDSAEKPTREAPRLCTRRRSPIQPQTQPARRDRGGFVAREFNNFTQPFDDVLLLVELSITLSFILSSLSSQFHSI